MNERPVQRRVALIGLRGSGKTTVGRLLARRLDVAFYDSDLALAERWGETSAEMLRGLGEPAFRRREVEIVTELSGIAEGVLALGGGAPASPRIERALRDWRVVLLDAPDEVLESRTRRQARRGATAPSAGDVGTDRPPLTNLSPLAEIQAVRRERWPAYLRLQPRIIPTAEAPPEAIAATIAAQLNETS